MSQRIESIFSQDFDVIGTKGEKLDRIRYSVGQGMGAYASFPILQVTNYMVASYAQTFIRTTTKGNNFHIVGDDIIFRNKDIAYAYRHIMEELDVSVNQDKIFENNLVQAVGFDICRSNNKPDIIQMVRPHKIRSTNINDKRFSTSLQYNFDLSKVKSFKPNQLINWKDYNEDLTPIYCGTPSDLDHVTISKDKSRSKWLGEILGISTYISTLQPSFSDYVSSAKLGIARSVVQVDNSLNSEFSLNQLPKSKLELLKLELGISRDKKRFILERSD